MRLGKRQYAHDENTVKLANFLTVPTAAPAEFDFDHNRKRLPVEPWGNYDWGNCVEVGKYHGLVRLERIESRRTLAVTEEDVVNHYKAECAAEWGYPPGKPGDATDAGLVVLKSLKDWRNSGLSIAAKPQSLYKIAAYGLLDKDDNLLRAACYGLHGVYFGLDLPLTAQQQIRARQQWDWTGGVNSEPGSWGGHLVYAKRYDRGGFYCITWGREQYMTNAFIEKYADEVWAVVDDFDSAKKSRYLDVDALVAYLRSIGAKNIG